MNTNRVIEKLSVISTSIKEFFFRGKERGDELPLFRFLVATLCLGHFISFGPDILNLYGQHGYIRGEIADIVLGKISLRLSWFTNLMSSYGWSENESILLLYELLLLSLGFLALGLFSRMSAFFAFVLHLAFVSSGKMFSYGVDFFMTSCLFYCIWMPVKTSLSIDSLFVKQKANASSIYGFSVRFLRLHLCLVYFFAGFTKALGTQWWNGEAIWRSLMQKNFNQFDFSWLAHVDFIPVVIGWCIIIIELLYPIFMNLKKTRKIWLVLVIGMHLGIMCAMGLWYFGLLLIIMNITAFVSFDVSELPVLRKIKILRS